MPLEKSERFICFGMESDSITCHCTCLDKVWDKKLMEYCKKFPDQFKMTQALIFDDVVEGHEFEFNKRLVSIRQPSKRKMSEQQKQEAGERLKKTRKPREKKIKENN